jgi:broad specificity phosphatase PhoE
MESNNTIFLIRHAESAFNILKANALAENKDCFPLKYKPELVDCTISPKGVSQAESVAEKLASENIAIVISSPLRRCLQTTKIIFENHKNKPKVIVWPIVREIFESSCDIPDDIEVIKKEFPEYDFSAFEEFKDDNIWVFETILNDTLRSELLSLITAEYGSDIEERNRKYRARLAEKMFENYPSLCETGNHVVERTLLAKKALLEKTKELNEGERLAVVSHSAFLIRFTAKNFDEKGFTKDGRYFQNCDIVEFNLASNSIIKDDQNVNMTSQS